MKFPFFENITSPLADAQVSGVLTCIENEVLLDGSNSTGFDLIYNWYNSNGQTIGDEAILVVANPGLYTLIVTDPSNGCDHETTV